MGGILGWLFGRREPPSDRSSASVIAGLPFDVVMAPGHEAVRTREALLARPGITPVILGDEDDVARLVDGMWQPGPPAPEIVAEAARVDLAAWRAGRRESHPDQFEPPPGTWPDAEPPPRELSVPVHMLTRRPKEQVCIALFETPRPWEVPAQVRYGGWQLCPTADVHVAQHAVWHERWGACIACMSADVIECTVLRPPATRPDALDLAREQLLYCPDLVNKGTHTLEALAAALVEARTWYFWWDGGPGA
jgi:hypothetical protein